MQPELKKRKKYSFIVILKMLPCSFELKQIDTINSRIYKHYCYTFRPPYELSTIAHPKKYMTNISFYDDSDTIYIYK